MKTKQQVVVVGLGRFGGNVARTLYQLGHDVMALDINEERVQTLMGEVTYPIAVDATQETVLRELGVHNVDIGIVGIGANIEASIMVNVLFQTMNIPYVVARAHSTLHGNTLRRLGCHRVVHAEEEMGSRLAHSLFNPDVEEYMELADAFGVSRVQVPDRLTNMTLDEAGFSGARDKYGIAIVALKRGNEIILSPDAEEQLRTGDVLVVAGRDEYVNRLTS